ncbi:hypothetical protein ACP70R_015943 [Stipagrostis hirtigluma subsp. patula]
MERQVYDKIPDHRHRIIAGAGEGFLYGAAGGSAWHFFRGFRSSAKGGGLAGGAQAVRTNVPRVACSFAAYFALYCALDGAISHARRREDPWNTIAASAGSAGLLNMRRGILAAARHTLAGATFAAAVLGLDCTASEWHSRRTARRLGWAASEWRSRRISRREIQMGPQVY